MHLLKIITTQGVESSLPTPRFEPNRVDGRNFNHHTVCISFGSPSANQFIDNVLQTSYPNQLRSLRLDPATLPNFNVRFGPMNRPQAEAEFFRGNVTGLSRLNRRYDCQGPKLVARQQYSINCTLSLSSVMTNYMVRVRNGSAIYNVKSSDYLQETLIDVEVVNGIIKHFRVTNLGLANPTFYELPSPMKQYVRVLQDAYRANVSFSLTNTIQSGVQNAFARAVAEKPFPRQ